MRYTVTFTEEIYNQLISHLFIDRAKERAGYLLCGVSESEDEVRLLVNNFIPVLEGEINHATSHDINIQPISYVRAIKKARSKKQSFVFVHSHPKGIPKHSAQDDIEESKLFRTVFNRIPEKKFHGSIVISDPENPIGRIWLEEGTNVPIELIRVIGSRIKFYKQSDSNDASYQFFDRQIRAFGEDIQKVLKNLTVGIVGTGGTGSAIAEQLIRLGVGTLNIFDGQKFEKTNINRVYGSRTSDDGTKKVQIIKRLAEEIGLGTQINFYEEPISYVHVAQKLKDNDLIFGCTDDHYGRSILCRLAVFYLIPVFDMGVKIDSKDGIINSIQGRVTTLFPGNSCLFCRGRINPNVIRAETLEFGDADKETLNLLKKEGYISELGETAPSVITFTTMIASTAINEFLHKLTGYMGSERNSTEVIQLFDKTEIRRNALPPKEECFCSNRTFFGGGDKRLFLDKTWRHD